MPLGALDFEDALGALQDLLGRQVIVLLAPEAVLRGEEHEPVARLGGELRRAVLGLDIEPGHFDGGEIVFVVDRKEPAHDGANYFVLDPDTFAHAHTGDDSLTIVIGAIAVVVAWGTHLEDE